MVESGLGAPIENSSTEKYLALHKTAPVGTIMQVKNAMNGLYVYVRVIGKLPNTGENNNILVRLSPRAVQKLGTSRLPLPRRDELHPGGVNRTAITTVARTFSSRPRAA